MHDRGRQEAHLACLKRLLRALCGGAAAAENGVQSSVAGTECAEGFEAAAASCQQIV
jgi:hypothetical protein